MFYGYKCFDKGLVNRYGQKFEVGKIYHCDGEIKFGNDGNGFHVCRRLEDTLRYFDAMNEEVEVCRVKCYGEYDEGEDRYNDYYDMFAFEYMVITKVLTREEIIKYGLSSYEMQVKRFIASFKLTPEEIVLFKERFIRSSDVQKTIAYYQEGDIHAFDLDSNGLTKKKRK